MIFGGRDSGRFLSGSQMTAQSSLDLRGNFRTHPFAELLIEISQARLSGSLRITRGDVKSIVYFNEGALVFAVTNERAFRLTDTLFDQKVIDPEFLKEHPHITNDLQLAEYLRDADRITADETKRLITGQCEAIIRSILNWPDGEWVYSPLTRIRAGISYNISFYKMLFEYSRSMSAEQTSARFRSLSELFVQRLGGDPDLDLSPQEAFVLSRFDTAPLSLEHVMSLSGSSESDVMQTLYGLWMGGLIERQNWNPAFSDIKIATILSANVGVKTRSEARQLPKTRRVAVPIEIAEENAPSDEEFDLEDQLSRIESAENYYEILRVDPVAKVATIRKSYFRMAKLLHPDRYHNEEPELLARVERAFTELAQAHETLKNNESRRSYDLRLSQETDARERARASGISPDANKQETQAAEDFERGLRLQLEREFEAAIPFLARAAHFAPRNARYRAFYGKALSSDETQRHKAEGEIQAAIKLEPQNDAFRLILAEFFVRFNLVKRAEGELTRLLKSSPGNKEAQALLDTLRSK